MLFQSELKRFVLKCFAFEVEVPSALRPGEPELA